MTKIKTIYLQGIFFLVLAQIMVGINIVASKYLLASIPILVILTIRFSLATLILLPLHWLTPDKNSSISHHFSQLNQKDWFIIFAQAVCAGALFNFFMLLGLHFTDANVAGIITSALPAIIAIFSWAFLHEKISGKKSLCVMFATIGLIIIACEKFHGIGIQHSFFGDAFVLISLIPEAAYYIIAKSNPNRLPVFLVSSLINGINAVILLVALALFPSSNLHIFLSDWLILFVLGLSSGLFYVLWCFGAQRVDGIMASLSTAVMPVSTVIFAWVLLGEQLTIGQFSGMALVMLSIAVYARP